MNNKRQWQCGECTFINSFDRNQCEICHATNPEYLANIYKIQLNEICDDKNDIEYKKSDISFKCLRIYFSFFLPKILYIIY